MYNLEHRSARLTTYELLVSCVILMQTEVFKLLLKYHVPYVSQMGVSCVNMLHY